MLESSLVDDDDDDSQDQPLFGRCPSSISAVLEEDDFEGNPESDPVRDLSDLHELFAMASSTMSRLTSHPSAPLPNMVAPCSRFNDGQGSKSSKGDDEEDGKGSKGEDDGKGSKGDDDDGKGSKGSKKRDDDDNGKGFKGDDDDDDDDDESAVIYLFLCECVN